MKSWWGKGRKETGWRFISRGKRNTRQTCTKILGVLLVVSVASVPLLYAGRGEPYTSGVPTSSPQSASPGPPSYSHPGNGSFPSFKKIWEGKFIEDQGPFQFIYTIDPILQGAAEEVFRVLRPPFGVFVAVEAKTGKILALADYARESSEYGEFWKRATYPAASVFKLITAASALEKGMLNFDSAVSFRGNQYLLGPSKINKTYRGEKQTQFDDALGKSNNVVFGRVASKLVGSQVLRQYSEAFGFNRPIQFDFPLDMSKAIIPDETYELARCGAGFGKVTLNPLHGAMIAACIANDGLMMRPFLIETIRSPEGELLYQARAEGLAQPITPRTAQGLNRMMRRTVEDGTASKSFRRYGKNLLKNMSVGGKTGSLSGDDPPGLYDWFVGFVPADDPQIAFSAMVVTYQSLKIRGAFVAQEALKRFFRDRPN